MSKIIHRFPLAAALLCMLLAGMVSLNAKDPDKGVSEKKQSLAKGTPYNTRYAVLNINNLSTFHRSDGLSNHSPASDNGLYYPKFTSWAIYQDGMMWGARLYEDAAKTKPAGLGQPMRVGGANYLTGTQPGRIIGTGATAVADDPNNPLVRSYRIRRDYYTMSEEELRSDAANVYEITIGAVTATLMAEVAAQYALDWTQWPTAWGAPYIDRNKNGRYDPPPAFSATFNADSLISQNRDEPGVAGSDPNSPADQVIWQVFNDLSRALTIALQGSEPMGLEIQKTLWGYKRADALGNLYFQRYKLINKGGVVLDAAGTKGSFFMDSMYVAQWSDPDLGGAGDDLIGCDTLLSMGYVYNGLAVDLEYRKYNLPPPSSGYDFLAGPIVPAAGKTAVFDLKYKPGFRNLGMTSFSWFSAGAAISDPPRSYAVGTVRWYKMLRGYAPVDGPDSYYPWHPGFLPAGPFPLSGDPVTGKGYIDGLGLTYSFTPGDRRLNLSTGPFTMAPGDTQEVTVGVVVGLGSDRLSSISVLKFNDRFAQNTFDALFAVPAPPTAPAVKFTEMDGKVILEWGSDVVRVADVEKRVREPGAYRFEGYNVYQLPSRGSRLAEGKRLATYDLATDPAVVLDEQFDAKSGLILNVPVQFGTNSGLVRYFEFGQDFVRDLPKLYNGQEYYLAVTAYSRATLPGYLPAALESSPLVLTVIPQSPKPGVRFGGNILDKIPVRVASGKTDIIPPILLVDPARAITATYQISFKDTAGGLEWSLRNKGTGATVFRSTNVGSLISGKLDDDYEFPIVNGIRPEIKQLAPVILEDSTKWIVDAARGLTGKPPQLGSGRYSAGPPAHSSRNVTTGLDLGALYLGQFATSYDHSKLKRVLFKTGVGNGSKAYRLRRTGAGTEYLLQTTVISTVGPNNEPIAPNGEPFVRVPFSAWDLDAPGGARQLTISWRDNDGSGTFNLPVGGDGLELIFVHERTYDPTGRQFQYPANPSKPGPVILNEATMGAQADIMFGLSFFAVGAAINGGDASIGKGEFYIRPQYTLNSGVVFEFDTKAPTVTNEIAVADVENVGVFPNPYYASNPAETNRFGRFVTFNFLPKKATIRIFNMGGQLVTTLEKDDASQFLRWNLTNRYNFPVASGMYVALIEMPELGLNKMLKLAIIQEQELLDVY